MERFGIMLVHFNGVNKKIGRFALKNISFELPKGYILGIVGENGGNYFPKISTTGLAGGLLTPYKGSLPAFESKDSSKSSPAAKHLPT